MLLWTFSSKCLIIGSYSCYMFINVDRILQACFCSSSFSFLQRFMLFVFCIHRTTRCTLSNSEVNKLVLLWCFPGKWANGAVPTFYFVQNALRHTMGSLSSSRITWHINERREKKRTQESQNSSSSSTWHETTVIVLYRMSALYNEENCCKL